MKMKYFNGADLEDKKIAASLRKCAEMYENGEIAEVYDELFDILQAIDEWEAAL